MPTPEPHLRKHPRFKVNVPVEIYLADSNSPIRGATADICQGGCYVETMYPFAIGTVLDLKVQITDTLLVQAQVVTCDPQVGNGIQFTGMLPEDAEQLRVFLDTLKTE